MLGKLLSLAVLIIYISISGCCNLANCDKNGGIVMLRLSRNGNNVFYGPDAINEKDSVTHFVLTDFKLGNPISLIDTFETVYSNGAIRAVFMVWKR